MEFRDRRKNLVAIDNITPLVDCMCLLLIFFMLSTTFTTPSAIRINLPEASGDAARREGKELRVKVDQRGLVYVGKESLTMDELSQRLRDAAASDRETQVVIEADEDSAHKYVVSVMDRAKTAGLNRLAIATRRKQ